MKKISRITKFRRPLAVRTYKKVFHIFPEGEKTEPLYFNMIKQKCKLVHLELHRSRKRTSAVQILKRAKKFIKNQNLNDFEEVWLVIDVDNNKKEDVELLLQWSNINKNYGVGLSNPKFEYWLLLHFEKADKIRSPDECVRRLNNYLKDYAKNFNPAKLSDNINQAINYAGEKHRQCNDWFNDYHTTVFKLIKKILDREDDIS